MGHIQCVLLLLEVAQELVTRAVVVGVLPSCGEEGDACTVKDRG
jgi:hypothetical protein